MIQRPVYILSSLFILSLLPGCASYIDGFAMPRGYGGSYKNEKAVVVKTAPVIEELQAPLRAPATDTRLETAPMPIVNVDAIMQDNVASEGVIEIVIPDAEVVLDTHIAE